MEEVIKCEPCNAEFHQSFLSAHIEAYHVQLRQEDMVNISCASCSFTANVLNKNSMVQHCLVTGHSIQDVEVDFASYLLTEQARICVVLEAGFDLVSSNMVLGNIKPIPENFINNPEKTAEQEKKPRASSRKRKKSRASAEEPKVSKKKQPEPDESQLEEHNKGLEMLQMTIKEEVVENESRNKTEKMPCQKCDKEISVSKNKGHTLQYAVGHVLSHLPDLKLFRCLPCWNEFKTQSNIRDHLKKVHELKLTEGTVDFLGTEDKAQHIRDNLSEHFPDLKWNTSLNIFKYA